MATTAQATRQAPTPFGCERRPAQYTGRNLHVSTAVEPAIAAADMVFLSVNTPTKARGIGAGQASDLRWIEAALR